MSHTAALCVNICASESRSCDIFVGYTFDNFWSGYEHLADVVDHKDKVCDSRAVYSTTGTVSGDNRNLRNITGSHCIIVEDLTITGKGVYSFLNTGSAGIVNTDDRTAVFDCHFNGICNFKSVLLSKSTTDYSKVFRIDNDFFSTNGTISGNYTIIWELTLFNIEGILKVRNVGTYFAERIFIKQKTDPL